MDIQQILKKSTRTDGETGITGTQFFVSPEGKGYLGVPKKYPNEVLYRRLLCENQELPHTPYMKEISESYGFIWFETVPLDKTNQEDYYRDGGKFHELYKLRTINLYDNYSGYDYESIILTIRKLYEQLPEELLEESFVCIDLHEHNIREDGNGNLYITDPFN